jgi:hypothetical protein
MSSLLAVFLVLFIVLHHTVHNHNEHIPLAQFEIVFDRRDNAVNLLSLAPKFEKKTRE